MRSGCKQPLCTWTRMPSDVNIPAHSSHSPVPAQVQQLGLAGVPNRLIPQSPSLLLGSSLSGGGGFHGNTHCS